MVRRNYTSVGEEIFNAVTHGVGAALGIIGWLVLVIVSLAHHDPGKIFGFTIFSVSLILMYLTSTLFHSLSFTRAKKVFRILDHSAVFLFIAGTYTPFLLAVSPDKSAGVFLAVIWLSAVLGIIFKVFFVNQIKLSLLFYLSLGWVSLSLIREPAVTLVINQVSRNFLILGGLAYSAGIIFYLWKKLVFNHGIWHLFVLSGTAFHFLSLLSIVARK